MTARSNRLAGQTIPYLLQHARNPVDWYPWGEEALDRARSENKLILLSIGYSACHWCHVMEQESFENDEIASIMNEHYVSIKVDREERPDIDEIYMSATLAMNRGQGGWPMTVFLTPDLEPVFAGTYYPPEDVPGRPGFKRLLTGIADAWEKNRAGVVEGAKDFADFVREQRAATDSLTVRRDEILLARDQLLEAFDPEFGGFGHAPKFPPATSLSFLLQLHHTEPDSKSADVVEATLDHMEAGGIYDHVGGGFARYSTDRKWLVPHFEKMLYDNALLARVYLEAWQVTKKQSYRRVARETLDFVRREMCNEEGAFCSSIDADSEGEEGKFYVWSYDELQEVLGDRFETYARAYDVTPEGNWEGTNILNRKRPLAEVASELNLDSKDLQAVLRSANDQLLERRGERVRPATDDKVITAWNGMMIGAFAFASFVLDDDSYLEQARRAADFIDTTLSEEGRLLRTYRSGKAHLRGYLEDYAWMVNALIDLYEAGSSQRYLEAALGYGDTLIDLFGDEEVGDFYNTAHDHEHLLVRYREGADGATPSANAVAAQALARLGRHFDRTDLLERAQRAIEAHGQAIARLPRGYTKSLSVALSLLDPHSEVVLTGRGRAGFAKLKSVLGGTYLPNRAIAIPVEQDASLPLTQGKDVDEVAGYVCRSYVCDAPTHDPEEFARQLVAGRH